MSKVVIVGGGSASGKTTIARRIAEQIGFEYIGKDSIKEEMFGDHTDAQLFWNWFRFEKLSIGQFHDRVQKAIQANKDVVIEMNWIPKHKAELEQAINGAEKVVEIHCQARGLTRFRRFVRRNESGLSHKVHIGRKSYPGALIDTLSSELGWSWYLPFRFNENSLVVDTTDIAAIDMKKVYDFVEQGLGKRS